MDDLGGGPKSMTENEIGKIIVDAAIDATGSRPGCWKRSTKLPWMDELYGRGLHVTRQVHISIEYDGMRFDEGFRADMIVEDKVILELKSVEKVTAAHKKQIQTYLRLTDHKLGFLLNFGEALMKHGITRAIEQSTGISCALDGLARGEKSQIIALKTQRFPKYVRI